MSATNLPLGVHGIYAKIYVNTEFVNSNVISIQVGDQLAYNDQVHAIPGIIEAGHYDYFEGGLGQGISYMDLTQNNNGDFRSNEYVW